MRPREILEDKIITLSNVLTCMRIVVAPFLGWFMYREHVTGDVGYRMYELGGILVIIFSDFFDGYLARLMKQETKLGQFLDPLADKISSLFVGIFLVIFKGFPLWLWIVALSRELLAVLFAFVMFSKKDIQVRPNIFGKFAAASLAFSCVVFMFSLSCSIYGITLKDLSVSLIVFFYVAGGVMYLKTYVGTRSVQKT